MFFFLPVDVPLGMNECDATINIHHGHHLNFIPKRQVCHLIFPAIVGNDKPLFVPDFCCFYQLRIFHDCPVFKPEHATLEILLKHSDKRVREPFKNVLADFFR